MIFPWIQDWSTVSGALYGGTAGCLNSALLEFTIHIEKSPVTNFYIVVEACESVR